MRADLRERDAQGASRADQGGEGLANGPETLDAKGNVKSTVTVRRGRKPTAAPPIGNPVASSTLYDREGRVTSQWIKTQPDKPDPERSPGPCSPS